MLSALGSFPPAPFPVFLPLHCVSRSDEGSRLALGMVFHVFLGFSPVHGGIGIRGRRSWLARSPLHRLAPRGFPIWAQFGAFALILFCGRSSGSLLCRQNCGIIPILSARPSASFLRNAFDILKSANRGQIILASDWSSLFRHLVVVLGGSRRAPFIFVSGAIFGYLWT